MASNGNISHPYSRFRNTAAVGALFAALTAVSGCSSVPDALNPVEWYKDTVDLFSGDEPAVAEQGAGESQSGPAADRGKPPPGADKPFPNLASVPEGLAADRKKRKYASDAVRLQGDAEQTLPSVEERRLAASEAPPPPIMPSAPVTQAPLAKPKTPAPALAARKEPSRAPSITASTMPAHSGGLSEFAPPAPGGVMETFQTRISQRRPAKGQTQLAAATLSIPFPSAGQREFSTVIISSTGIEQTQDVPMTSAPPKPGRLAAPPPLAPAPARIEGSVRPLTSGSVKVATIQFPNGSSRLDAASRRVLNDVSRLQRKGGGKVRVVGHASSRTRSMDPVRHKMVNYRISVDRAERVVSELRRLGVSQSDIILDAYSDSAPVYYEFMPSGEAGNRRAEIYIER
ncbi:MAG: OmpA family protein [Rhodospirillales bacterium]